MGLRFANRNGPAAPLLPMYPLYAVQESGATKSYRKIGDDWRDLETTDPYADHKKIGEQCLPHQLPPR